MKYLTYFFFFILLLSLSKCKSSKVQKLLCLEQTDLPKIVDFFKKSRDSDPLFIRDYPNLIERMIALNDLKYEAQNAVETINGCGKDSVIDYLNHKLGDFHYEMTTMNNEIYEGFYFIYDTDNCKNLIDTDLCNYMKFVFNDKNLLAIKFLY